MEIESKVSMCQITIVSFCQLKSLLLWQGMGSGWNLQSRENSQLTPPLPPAGFSQAVLPLLNQLKMLKQPMPRLCAVQCSGRGFLPGREGAAPCEACILDLLLGCYGPPWAGRWVRCRSTYDI